MSAREAVCSCALVFARALGCTQTLHERMMSWCLPRFARVGDKRPGVYSNVARAHDVLVLTAVARVGDKRARIGVMTDIFSSCVNGTLTHDLGVNMDTRGQIYRAITRPEANGRSGFIAG